MNNDPHVREAIELLAEHEKVIGDLYRIYTKRFKTKIWQWLAQEEDYHAKWLLSFFDHAYDGKIYLTSKYSREAIWQSIKRIKALIVEAESHTAEEATTYALAIESMVYETDFVRVFDEGEPSVQEVMIRLAQGTAAHKAKIERQFQGLLQD